MNLFAISLLIPLLGGLYPVSDVSVETIELVQKSTIPIMCVKTDSNNKLTSRVTLGTGFFINRDGDLITAAHVVTALAQQVSRTKCFGAIYVVRSEWKARYQPTSQGLIRLFKIGDCYSRNDMDLAVCHSAANPFVDAEVNNFIRPIGLTSFTKFNDGSPVAFTGFPIQSVYPITSKGYIASYNPHEKKLIIDKTAWGGASGSPVYGTDGKVVAVLIERGSNAGAGLCYARPTDFVLDLLREQKIATEK